MKIYLATWLEDNQGVTLTKVGNKRRLISYFFLKDSNDFLKEYIETGMTTTKKNKRRAQ